MTSDDAVDPVTEAPVVEITGATVRFAGTLALDHVDFRVHAGEVHSLMGENGAGKSTLIRALTGARPLDEGVIRIHGKVARFARPRDAQRAGIAAVYQEIDLLPNLSVAENVLLGREPRRFGAIDWPRMRREAGAVLAGLGIDIDPASALGSHSVAVQQLVAIARAISREVSVLVLDEPTSSLDLEEVAELFRVIRELKDRGVAIVFISHFLDQVYEICDRITVLRNGSLVGEFRTEELLRIDLVQKMLGRGAEQLVERPRPEVDAEPRRAVLRARGLASRRLRPTDVVIGEGEVLGLAGLLGSGRTALARLLSGVDRPAHGRLELDAREVRLGDPRRATRLGVVYSSENRRSEGIIDQLSVAANITLALQAQRGAWRPLRKARRDELVASWIEALDIRPRRPELPVGVLSGGNQQKVLLARLLALAPRVIVLDEPTRGIDVGAKVELQNLVSGLADNGMSVVFVSGELEEVVRVSDQIAILRDGAVVDVVPGSQVTVDTLLAVVGQPDEG
ncbi:MAG: sugar ABC transporter ATP-binding protein [Actinomycetales bacterium]|nr:sugar ABC transporter ATP-binding protein [Actinomycetales bacterium]